MHYVQTWVLYIHEFLYVNAIDLYNTITYWNRVVKTCTSKLKRSNKTTVADSNIWRLPWITGIATTPNAPRPWNKALIRPNEGTMVVNNPLFPKGVPWNSHCQIWGKQTKMEISQHVPSERCFFWSHFPKQDQTVGQWGPLWSKPCQLHPSDQVTRIDPPNDGGHKKSFEQVT